MTIFIQQVINGLMLGSVYALLALGYTMVYGIIKLINFAHGDIYMLGAYFGYFFIKVLHLNFFIALILAMAVSAVIGVLIEYIAYRPLRHSPRIAVLISALGISFLLENGMTYLYGSDQRSFPQAIKTVQYHFYGIQVSNIQLIIAVTSVVLMLLLTYVVKRTKMGRAMRAVSADPDAATLMGININHTISFTFAIGSALAAAGGVLIGLYYNSIDPLMGMTPGLKAFVAAVLGGIGIIPGAAVGGWLIGILETMVQATSFSAYKDAVVYAMLIVILLIKPTGILGKNKREKV
ncbi:branched-chain amino acid ABC transporter permease [Leuconostoc falkenbergense]|jgi:branched-chain amino acid transport system permease protein|uniref:Branched-chain amino acid ABC transporter permease n=1 Tax=Leuconostoc falkenbergense TaxID=2766470 RepID=A0A9X3E747_9LACO|nr:MULTISPECIES: branched-chain amino acid ABC transporter permease [Leuconostoc]RDG17862.1 branched-chain amino acid ABC transporter permease [Leuconostoc pseudomesenteroides]MCT4389103.1 branched-chain amino acid ABC transporter permease [Leuconostoc falkenbergense]MCT4410401.1 branched-chain amino acid ABC transporter permease [Leuconostoc falkenbergense]MCX7578027.1 branched-chain amino acid ABC transporter permease [Leuconostoc falkenbergense]MDI6553901.1 branched-chain amino acid ABC tra